MKQCGIKHAVSGISLQPYARRWRGRAAVKLALSLMRAKASFETNGFEMLGIESQGGN